MEIIIFWAVLAAVLVQTLRVIDVNKSGKAFISNNFCSSCDSILTPQEKHDSEYGGVSLCNTCDDKRRAF